MEWGAIVAIIGAAVGATTGLLGYIIDAVNNHNYNNQKIADTQKDKELALADLELDFKNAEEEANKNADRSDATSTMNESSVSNGTNNALDQLRLNQEMEGLGFNQAAQSAGQQEGAELASMADSGTRAGGSLSAAVDMQKSQNAMQLQLSEDATRKNDEMQLANVLQGLNESTFGIQANRTDAQDLKESFTEGGYNYKKYQNAKERTESGFNQQIWEYQNSNAQDEGWNAFWKGAAALLGGGNQGVTAATQIYNYASQAKTTYNTSTNFQSIGSGQQIDYSKPFGNFGTGNFSTNFRNISFW